MSGQYLVFAIQFATTVLISRFFLTPEEVGVFSLALSAAMLVSILQDFGITRYIANEKNLSAGHIQTCFSVSILFALAVALVILALAWPAASFYGDPRLFTLLTIIAGSFVFTPFGIVPCALLQRDMHFGSLAVVNFASAVAQGLVAISLAALDYSAYSLAWGAVAQQAFRAIVAWLMCQHKLSIRFSVEGAKPILRFGSTASFLYINGSVGVRAPELIIGHMLGMTAVGLYGRANSLSEQIRSLVSGTVSSVFFTAFARMRDRGELLEAPYLRVVSAYCAVTWPAMAVLSAAALPIILLLYGPVWSDVAPLLLWIALGQIAVSALPLHMDIPIVMGQIGRLLRLNILDSIASIVFLVIAATWDLEAAAISRVAYSIVWYAIYARFMRRIIEFRWKPMLAIYLRSAIVTLATVLPLLLTYEFIVPPSQIGFVMLSAAVFLGGVAWLAVLFAVRHPMREDVTAIIASLWTPLTGKLRSMMGSRKAGAKRV